MHRECWKVHTFDRKIIYRWEVPLPGLPEAIYTASSDLEDSPIEGYTFGKINHGWLYHLVVPLSATKKLHTVQTTVMVDYHNGVRNICHHWLIKPINPNPWPSPSYWDPMGWAAQSPKAIFPEVLAEHGATSATSAHLRSSTCTTRSDETSSYPDSGRMTSWNF